jgi:dTDP-4-dehydrorhamnose reductase
MLGKYVYLILNKYYNIINITRNDFNISNDKWDKLKNLLNNILETNDVIINCAGIIPQKYNKDNISEYIKINTLFPHKLDEIANNIKCKFIHITTDCVYDGKIGNYYPNDKHTAIDIYGISKSLGETENSCIIRTSIIGEEVSSKKSLLEWLISNKNNLISGYTNHIWNGITCLELANIILEIINKNNYWKGVRHIFSPNQFSKYDLCCLINKIYNLNLIIKKYECNETKIMTLTDNLIMCNKNLDEQIKELKEFSSHINYLSGM